MPLDILKGTLIFFSTLRRLAQKETSIPIPFRQMPPFTIRRSSSSYFHQERCPTIGKVMQEPEIKRRAQVIGIGNKEKLLAVAQQRFEKTPTHQRRIDVSMSRGAPFQLRISRPGGRQQSLRIDFWSLALQKLQRGRITQLRIKGKGVLGCGARVEAIHEIESKLGRMLGTRLQKLANDYIQKSESWTNGQQALRSFQSHAGSQAAV